MKTQKYKCPLCINGYFDDGTVVVIIEEKDKSNLYAEPMRVQYTVCNECAKKHPQVGAE